MSETIPSPSSSSRPSLLVLVLVLPLAAQVCLVWIPAGIPCFIGTELDAEASTNAIESHRTAPARSRSRRPDSEGSAVPLVDVGRGQDRLALVAARFEVSSPLPGCSPARRLLHQSVLLPLIN